MSCSTAEHVKTTKVYIEIGATKTIASNDANGQAEIHKSKKSYSGYQHKTKLSHKVAFSTDTNSHLLK